MLAKNRAFLADIRANRDRFVYQCQRCGKVMAIRKKTLRIGERHNRVEEGRACDGVVVFVREERPA